MKKISIIVPIYNCEKYISRCIESIVNQTYKNIEIILINDGSTDSTINILKNYEKRDNRINIINKSNTGVSDSRNIGIKKSTGDYIIFVDSDDWLEPDMIEKMTKKIEEKNVEVVRCNYYRNYEDNTQKIIQKYNEKIKEKVLYGEDIRKEILLKILSGEMQGYMWLLLIQKEVFKKLKPFDKRISMMEDTVFYIDLLLNIDSIYIYDKALYHYYYNKNSASKSAKNFMRNYRNLLLVNTIESDFLKAKNLNNEKIKILYNTAHSEYIENICFSMFNIVKKEELVKYYFEIMNNDDTTNIINNSDLKKISLHHRIALIIIKFKKINILIKYYEIRDKFSKLKTFITKRKEI